MKKHNTLYVLFTLLWVIPLFISGCQENRKNDNMASEKNSKQTAVISNKKQLRHVVLFKFKDGVTQEDIAKVEEAFTSLPSKIPEIKGFEWGVNNSPEGLNKGYSHCFLLTFDSEKDRAVYLPHPDHKALGQSIGMYIDNVLVIDYWN